MTVREASLGTVVLVAAAALAPAVALAEPFTLEAGGSKSGHGRSWWLAKGINVFGSGNPYPVLRATMAERRVRSFALQIGAAGD